ncbi:MAG: SDR family oxidoreductase, partial [Coriobacteriales bacterium]|nr:SDR family oxidoreductase [Coriobacteriales bacterium]
GGAGFIGSNIVDALLADGGYEVRVLDNFATGRRSNLDHCRDKIDVVEGDVRDLETVEEAVDSVDCILHQAALPSVLRSVKAPITTNDVNIGGTLRLLSAAHKAGVRRVVFASSSSVYGDAAELPKAESMTPAPLSPYAVTKLACEQYVRVFAQIYGMESLSMRYFNIFGPRQDPTSQYSGVIAAFSTAALAGAPFIVYGDGTQARDFTFVENVVHANLLALQAPQLKGEVVNIACGNRVTLLEMIDTIAELEGIEPTVLFREARKGDVHASQADTSRAAQLLGYQPTCQFAEGIKRTLDWYRKSLGV